MRHLTAVVAVATAALIMVTPTPAVADHSPGHLKILVLSNRADLLSGSDALAEVVLPAGTDASRLRVQLETSQGSRDVSDAFAMRPGGHVVGLVDGLPVGRSLLIAAVGGRHALPSARITLTNHPNGGPVFSGPQVAPWVCTTQNNGLGMAQDG